MILTNIYRKIKEYNTIIIHRHTKPDGDALGSQIGLKESLIATFPNKCIKAVGDMSERYSFIGEMDEIDDSLYENAILNQLGNVIVTSNIDTANNISKIINHSYNQAQQL